MYKMISISEHLYGRLLLLLVFSKEFTKFFFFFQLKISVFTSLYVLLGVVRFLNERKLYRWVMKRISFVLQSFPLN